MYIYIHMYIFIYICTDIYTYSHVTWSGCWRIRTKSAVSNVMPVKTIVAPVCVCVCLCANMSERAKLKERE